MKAVLALLALAGVASADQAKVSPGQALVETYETALRGDVKDPKLAASLMVAPFAYSGFRYDGAGKAACKKKFGAKGTVKAADLAAFVDCAAISDTLDAFDNGTVWSEPDPKKLDKGLRSLKAPLAKLGKRHKLVMAYYVNAGTGAHWNVYAYKDVDGKPRLAAWFTVHFCDGCP